MSYFLAFARLRRAHHPDEFGHFATAKAVGMRVDASPFFGPLLVKVRPARPSTASARSRSAAT